jgi:hypothetical protein
MIKLQLMKYLLHVIVLVFLSHAGIAQKKGGKITIRTMDGTKLTGKLIAADDSSIHFKKADSSIIVAVNQINTIRLRNSFGTNALIIGGSAGLGAAIIGFASGEEKINDGTLGGALHDAFTATPGEAAASGFILGAAAGTAAAGIVSATRGKMKFSIKGKSSNWALALPKIKKQQAGSK